MTIKFHSKYKNNLRKQLHLYKKFYDLSISITSHSSNQATKSQSRAWCSGEASNGGSNLRVSGLQAGCLNLQCVRRLSLRVQVARHSGHSKRPGKCTWQWLRMCVTTLPHSLQRCRFKAPATRSNVSRMCHPLEPATTTALLTLCGHPFYRLLRTSTHPHIHTSIITRLLGVTQAVNEYMPS